MRYRRLGSSDLQISEISLGSWLTFGHGVQADRAEACLRRALELGINFIDTANVYGRGAAESFLGEALVGVERSSYLLATKAYFPMSESDRGLSAAQIHKQCDASLRRLRTDHVDLYQCHRYDAETPLVETMEALTELVRAGKTRYIGFSEWTAEQISAALAVDGVERFVSSQPEYSMLYRKPEPEVIPLCAREGISQVVWSPLAQGILTGKYRPGTPPPPDTRAASESMGSMMGRWRDDDVLAAVDRLRPIAEGLGVPMAQMALAWVLRQPNVASAITGASRPEQVDQNAAASGIILGDDVLVAIDEALGDAVGP
ncbi:MAG: aldo/keto reductase family protein [Acidimicrobiia bacterium]|nr:aldo/keto reductase family protein [Acidimicrobiia bacterium]